MTSLGKPCSCITLGNDGKGKIDSPAKLDGLELLSVLYGELTITH